MDHNRVSNERIGSRHEGQRLDNWLATRLKGVPKSHVYRLLRTGQVRVNGRRAKPGYRLETGDVVRVPPVRQAPKGEVPKADEGLLKRLSAAVLYEDDALLVIDKPSGLPVHAGSGVRLGLIEALAQARPDQKLDLVHRLDRDTSGCLVVAKQRDVLGQLHRLLREGGVTKQYLALTRGRWPSGARTVDAPLAQDRVRSGERMVEVSEDGRRAATSFEPVEDYGIATLVRATLDTGRKHQIRVHAAHVGCPVAGDRKYGDEDFNRDMKSRGLRRLFLHAQRLAFHLDDGREVDVSAPLPQELRELLDELERSSEKGVRSKEKG